MSTLGTRWEAFQEGLRGQQAFPRWIASLGLLAVAVALALVSAPLLLDPRFHVSWDGMFYLSDARYLYDGQGYMAEPGAPRLGRPPGFPALLASAFILGGPTVTAASWVVRLAGLAAATAVATMSYRMFGTAVALLVVPWAVSNEFFVEYAARVLILDMTQVALGLISVWLVYEAAKRASLKTYALAGLAFAAAFWVKESILLLQPLPLIALLINPSWHTWRHFKGVLVYGFVAALLVLPWFVFVFLEAGSLYRVGSAAKPELLVLLAAIAGVGMLTGFWAWRRRRHWIVRALEATAGSRYRLILGWGAALLLVCLTTAVAGVPEPTGAGRHFAERVRDVDLRPLGYLGPFVWVAMVLGWLFSLGGALRRNPADAALVAALLASIPVMTFVADRNLAPRNYLLVLMLTHVVLGRMSVSLMLGAWRVLNARGRQWVSRSADVAVGVALGLSLLLPCQILAENLAVAAYTPIHNRQRTLEEAFLVAQWTREKFPPGERLHITASSGGAALRFTLGSAYPTPWVRSEWVHQKNLEAGLMGNLPGKDRDGRPYRGLSGVVFVNANRSIFVGDWDAERAELQIVQVPDLVNGEMPRHLAWIASGTAVFPDVIPEFLLKAGWATVLESPGGVRILRFEEHVLPNVLLINEEALDDLDGARDSRVQLSSILAPALRGWRVIVLDEENKGKQPLRQLCDDLRHAVPEIQCWDGALDELR